MLTDFQIYIITEVASLVVIAWFSHLLLKEKRARKNGLETKQIWRTWTNLFFILCGIFAMSQSNAVEYVRLMTGALKKIVLVYHIVTCAVGVIVMMKFLKFIWKEPIAPAGENHTKAKD